MAFCPHCGQRTGDQAIKCVACGKDIQPAQGAPTRFKGTMMMSAPQAGAAAAAAHGATAKAAKKPLGATMVGGMVAPAGENGPPAPLRSADASPPPTATGRAPVSAPPSAAAVPSTPPTAEQKPASHSQSPRAEAGRDSVPRPLGAAAGPPHVDADHYPEETSRVLPGDPMAAFQNEAAPRQPGPAPSLQRPAPEMFASRHSMGSTSGLLWLAIGFVGMLTIAGLGILAAKFMGLM